MPRSYSEDERTTAPKQPKRTAACLNCRRQKLKCDGSQDKPCTRCRTDGIECVVRPRVNAALVADDLRWQQGVERRLQSLQTEIEEIKSVNAELVRRMAGPSPSNLGITPAGRPPSPPRPPPALLRDSSLVEHLIPLRDILYPVFQELQEPTPLDVSLDDATVLWESFYDSLAIFHGFTASTDLATPSPLLFSAVVTASANRFAGRIRMRTPVDRWEELFKRALVRLLYVTVPKTWDDSVGLGIARTWFWKADEITAGLLYGSFVETQSPNQSDFRNRRVWDFLEMTTVSHGILHLSTPIVPVQPPRGVPDRRPSHILLMALNELFDSLGVVNRALVNARSLVQTSLLGHANLQPLTFAEVVVLRNCRADLERWCPKWLYEIQHVDANKLPTGSGRDFLLGVVTLYFHVAILVTDGYLSQSAQPETAQFHQSARDLLALVGGKWSESLHLWPKLFLHSSLLAAIALPPDDPFVRRAHDLFTGIRHILVGSGDKLLRRLNDRVAQDTQKSLNPVPAFTPKTELDIPMSTMAYSGSDSFWADLSGVLGIATPSALPLPVDAAQMDPERVWPREMGWDSGLRMDRQGQGS